MPNNSCCSQSKMNQVKKSIAKQPVQIQTQCVFMRHDRELDWDQFKQAMEKEIHNHMDNGNMKVVPRSKVTSEKLTLPAVWQMRRKRKMNTGEICKWKARLNLDGSRQQKGLHCDKTCAPAVGWLTVCSMLIVIPAWRWQCQQLDCASAFMQAPVEREMCIHIPKGHTVSDSKLTLK